MEVDRFETSFGRAYAQIDIADSAHPWDAALDRVQSLSAIIPQLVSRGSIGTPSLDVAMDFPHADLSKSLTLPAALVAAAGEAGIDIQLSVYKTA
jgi:hypothetical protein